MKADQDQSPMDFYRQMFIGSWITQGIWVAAELGIADLLSDGPKTAEELATVGAKKAASGNGYFPGDFSDVGVSVKDSLRFANEPGKWGFFHFIAEGGKSLPPTAKSQPTAACSACHQKNAAQDLVFTQHYPVLRAVKPK